MFVTKIEEHTPEWFEIRRQKITASDAPIIMGDNPWKSPYTLYMEKIHGITNNYMSDRMLRGHELESEARELFEIKTGLKVEKKVIVKDWAMASLDGISLCNQFIVEIKCPSEKAHKMAVNGKVPDYYYAQLQHQMYVADLDECFYFSYDGIDGVIVRVKRDEFYIDNMIEKEKEFLERLIAKNPPEKPKQKDVTEREDEKWKYLAGKWKTVKEQLDLLQNQEKALREELIELAGDSTTMGAGVMCTKIEKKGNIDYSQIPELHNINLEIYRKPATFFWKFTSL